MKRRRDLSRSISTSQQIDPGFERTKHSVVEYLNSAIGRAQILSIVGASGVQGATGIQGVTGPAGTGGTGSDVARIWGGF